jgi:hypothetical protein
VEEGFAFRRCIRRGRSARRIEGVGRVEGDQVEQLVVELVPAVLPAASVWSPPAVHLRGRAVAGRLVEERARDAEVDGDRAGGRRARRAGSVP